jgi:hypothetical protein
MEEKDLANLILPAAVKSRETDERRTFQSILFQLDKIETRESGRGEFSLSMHGIDFLSQQ